MIKYFIKYKIRSFLLFTLILMESTLNVVAITQINSVISSLLEKNTTNFIKLAIINIVLWILFICINTIKGIYQEHLIQKMIICVKNDIAKNLISFKIDEYYNKKPKEYISWFNQDCDKIESGFNFIISTIKYILLISISMVSILNMSYKIIIYIIINLIIIFITPQFLMKRLQAHTISVSKENEMYISKIGNILDGYKILYFSNAFNIFLDKISKYSKNLSKRKISLEVKSQFINMIIQFLSILSQIGLILYSGYLVLKNQLEFGNILVISNLSGQLFNHISSLTGLVTKIQSLNPIIEKLNLSSIKTKNINIIKNDKKINEISLNNLYFSIQDKKILKDININFKKGKKYLIHGDSGSGKSTLMKLICGINKNFDGVIKINNTTDSVDSYINDIDYLEENTVIFDMSLKENITLNNNNKNYEEILNIVGLNKLDCLDVHALSLGEKQRIGIAQVLLKNKSVMCFDESFSNLDYENLNNILRYILSLDSTVIIISHHLTEKKDIINLFDYIIHIKNGQIFDVI